MLLNVNTHRKYWHSGAGIDNEDIFDRYEEEKRFLGDIADKIHKETKERVSALWDQQLGTQ